MNKTCAFCGNSFFNNDEEIALCESCGKDYIKRLENEQESNNPQSVKSNAFIRFFGMCIAISGLIFILGMATLLTAGLFGPIAFFLLLGLVFGALTNRS